MEPSPLGLLSFLAQQARTQRAVPTCIAGLCGEGELIDEARIQPRFSQRCLKAAVPGLPMLQWWHEHVLRALDLRHWPQGADEERFLGTQAATIAGITSLAKRRRLSI